MKNQSMLLRGLRNAHFSSVIGKRGLFRDGDWVESKDQDPTGDVRLVQLADIGEGLYLNKSARFLTSSKAKELRCTFLHPGDLLVARMPDPIGRACVFPGDPKPCVTAVDVCIVRPDPELVDVQWLKWATNSPEFRSHLGRFTAGTTRKRISRKNLEQIPLKIPPLPEQRRIAGILDKADAIRRKRQETIRLTDELLRSAFLDMFGDPTTNPKEWETKPIKKIGKVVTGNTPSRKKQEYYGDHIEWIKSNNINTPFHFLTEAEEYLSQQGKQVGRSVPAYSILVSCIAGTPECIGNAALADREVAFNQQINAIVPFKYTDPYFLYSQLLVAKKLVQRESTNSMKGLVSKSKFEKINLLIPPKEKQNKFREIFMEYLTLHERQTKLQMESDFLFNSLNQRAFRGEL